MWWCALLACILAAGVLAGAGVGDAQEDPSAPQQEEQEEPSAGAAEGETPSPAAVESLERMKDVQRDAGAGELDVARDTATSAALAWEETGADAERQSSEVMVTAAQAGIDGESSPLLEEQPPEAAPEPGGEQPTTADAIRVTVTVNDKRLDVTDAPMVRQGPEPARAGPAMAGPRGHGRPPWR